MRTPQTPVLHPALLESDSTAIPVVAVHTQNWSVAAARFGPLAEQFAKAQDFKGKDGNCLCLPDADGRTIAVLFGLGESLNEDGVFAAGRLPNLLPAGQYRLDSGWPDPELAVLAFALGSYRFTRYKHSEQQPRQLVVPEGVDGEAVSAIAKAVFMGRDLINTPANDMGPQEIEDAACALADQFCATFPKSTSRGSRHTSSARLAALSAPLGPGPQACSIATNPSPSKGTCGTCGNRTARPWGRTRGSNLWPWLRAVSAALRTRRPAWPSDELGHMHKLCCKT
jgi:hypothetical protein